MVKVNLKGLFEFLARAGQVRAGQGRRKSLCDFEGTLFRFRRGSAKTRASRTCRKSYGRAELL